MNDDLRPLTPPEEEPPAAETAPEPPEDRLPALLGRDWEEPDEDDEAVPEPDAFYYRPAEAPVAAAPAPARRAWLWAVPMALLVAACAYLAAQNWAAAATVEALTTRVPQLLLPPGTPNPVAAQLGNVAQDAKSWNFLGARRTAAALELPPGLQAKLPGPDSGLPAAEGTVPNVSPEAKAFFKEHVDLDQRFGGYAEQALALRKAGKDVQPLRDLRQEIFDAATQGDVARVRALLDKFAAMLREMGGNPEGSDMQQIVGEFQQAFAQAGKEGRDPRAAVALMRQAEAAATAGDKPKAVALARQALVAIKRAPRGSGGRRGGGGMPMMGPRPGQAERVLGAVFSMLGQEDQDLAATHEAVDRALKAQLQDDPQAIREALGKARETLVRLHDRRIAFGQALQGGKPAEGARPASGDGERPPTVTRPRPVEVPPQVLEQFANLLDTIRGMTVDEYHERRDRITQKMIGMLLGRPGPGEEYLQIPPNMPPDERIRQKLRAAQEPYIALKADGQDVSELTELLAGARRDLAAGCLETAEKQVDEVLQKLGLLPKPEPPLAPPTTPPAGEQPAPAPTPPAATEE